MMVQGGRLCWALGSALLSLPPAIPWGLWMLVLVSKEEKNRFWCP